MSNCISWGSTMTEIVPRERKYRASRPKVRSGCVTCKSRHKKCDEQRPSCLMCTSTGRKCEYRETPDRRTRASRIIPVSHQLNHGEAKTFQEKRPTSVLMAPLIHGSEVDLKADERWYLDYFRKVTSLQCSSYFYDEFWERLVHQASEIQPAVRHAVIGMGALNLQFSQLRMGKNTGPLDRMFSIQQCNRAVVHLQQNLADGMMRRVKVETALVTCLVLVCVILFQEDPEMAGRHLKAGENLLKQYVGEHPSPNSVTRALKQTFAATQLVYTTFANRSLDKKDLVSPWLVPDEPPKESDNIQKTHDFLLTLSRMVMQENQAGFRMVPSDPDLDCEPFAVITKLRGWTSQLRATVAVHKGLLGQKDINALIILELWHEVISILIAVSPQVPPVETKYDSLLPRFERVLHLSETLFNSTSDLLSKLEFPAKTSIFPALSFCVLKCRDWLVRKRALVSLRQWECREGSSIKPQISFVLQRAIEIEMKGKKPGDLGPEARRIESIIVEIPTKEPTLHFRYRLSRYTDVKAHVDQPWQSEWLQYEPSQLKGRAKSSCSAR